MRLLFCFVIVADVAMSLLLDPYTTQPTPASSYNLLIDDIIDLRHRLASTESTIAQLQTQLAQEDAQLQKEMAQKDAQIVALQNGLSSVQHKLNGSLIAFSVILDKPLESLHLDQSVPFNRVLTDIRGNYNPSSGHFTAPETDVAMSLLLDPYTTEPTPASNNLLVDDIIDLRHRLAAMETTVAQLQSQLAQKDAQILTLQNGLSNVKKHFNGTNIAFSAILDKSLQDLHLDQSIPFNHVLTDLHGNYNPSSGHFTAPETGVYFFTWHTQTVAGHVLTTCLAVNGICKLHAYANAFSEHSSDIQPDGNSAVISLSAGDVVWISVKKGQNLYSNSGYGWFYPSFSGFNIFK